MISRAEWRDILQRIKKGGVEELKSYSTNVAKGAYNEAFVKGMEAGLQKGYEQGVSAGVDATKTSIISIIEKTLHNGFKFGEKRLAKFNELFLEEIRSRANNKDEIEKEDEEQSTQQMIMTREDKQRYMMLNCIAEFLLESLKSSNTYMFDNDKTRHQLEAARDNVEFLLHSIKDKISPQEHNRIMEELEGMTLYLSEIKMDKKIVS